MCVLGGGGGSSCLSTGHWYNKGVKESVGKGLLGGGGGGGVLSCEDLNTEYRIPTVHEYHKLADY